MPQLVQKTLEALRSSDPEAVALATRRAASFFERARGSTQGLDREEVLAEPATHDALAALSAALVDLVGSRPQPSLAGSAVFALGKRFDAGLEPFFVRVMRDYLDGDANVLYQAMIALDNLGVPVFGDQHVKSVMNVAGNRARAAVFLRPAAPDR